MKYVRKLYKYLQYVTKTTQGKNFCIFSSSDE